MTYVDFGIVRTFRRLFSEFVAYRDELRTERHINTLPDYVLKDIGWPDAYAERLSHRARVRKSEAGADSASSDLAPWQIGWPRGRESRKVSKSGHFGLEC
ncbi:hypothetical protein FHS20_003080 [Phyllobacterium endophyticum]|jgi:hypothetical protein|nr:hypothetical protein [Phyllobacterium endophyticum]TXR49103.1 hypothetical protein FVA77_10715 [Phyllobacterium endophyticum]TYR41381.1 hypothetical protein FY050_08780 [Phyllobacterium endophyticum]